VDEAAQGKTLGAKNLTGGKTNQKVDGRP